MEKIRAGLEYGTLDDGKIFCDEAVKCISVNFDIDKHDIEELERSTDKVIEGLGHATVSGY